MNNLANAGLQGLATGLIGLGVVSFTSVTPNIYLGIVEVILGLAVYAAYEYFPSK